VRSGRHEVYLHAASLFWQIEDLMDKILEIADDSTNDWIDREGADGKKYRVFNPDSVR
jgi:hypothetical protein